MAHVVLKDVIRAFPTPAREQPRRAGGGFGTRRFACRRPRPSIERSGVADRPFIRFDPHPEVATIVVGYPQVVILERNQPTSLATNRDLRARVGVAAGRDEGVAPRAPIEAKAGIPFPAGSGQRGLDARLYRDVRGGQRPRQILMLVMLAGEQQDPVGHGRQQALLNVGR